MYSRYLLGLSCAFTHFCMQETLNALGWTRLLLSCIKHINIGAYNYIILCFYQFSGCVLLVCRLICQGCTV